MAGLSFNQHQELARKQLDAVNRYLAGFPWQRVLVLTMPRGSKGTFVHETYPLFLSILTQHIGAPVQDFWDTERGELFDRLHMNVLLASEAKIPREVVSSIWAKVAGSRLSNDEYDAKKGPGYWIKDLGSLQADSDYGGSVIHLVDFPSPGRPRRKSKADHNRERARRRFRPQPGGLFHQSPVSPVMPSRRALKWQATADRLEQARQIRQQQGVA